jgi:hypothetical protein
VLAVRGRRAAERGGARRSAAASSVDEVNAVRPASTRPGNRSVISCSSQPMPSGSLNDAYEA